METSVNDSSTLFRTIIAQWCDVPVPETLAGAEQVLRSQLHPSLFRSLQSMSRVIRSLPLPACVQIIDRVGLDSLAQVYQRWYPDALPMLQAVETTTGEAATAIRVVCDLAVLAAAFDAAVLDALYTAVAAVQTALALARQFGAGETMPEHVMVREWTQQQRTAQSEQHASVPRTVAWVNPVMIPVSTSLGTHWMRIPVQVRVHDPIEQSHDVVIHQPVPVTEEQVDRVVSIPSSTADQGMTMLFRLRDRFGFWSATHWRHLFPNTFRKLFEHSGGAPVTVGQHGDLRLTPIHFHSASGALPQLPEEPVAALRRRSSLIDIQRLHPDVQLTVLA